MNAKRKIVLMILTVFCMIFGTVGLVGCGGGSLEAPTNIKYDGSHITWDKVEGATGYFVQINEGNSNNSSTNTFSYDAQGTEIVVKVKAVAKTKRKTIESEETVMNFMPLPTITDVTVSSTGVVSWTAQTGCVYAVKDNGTELPATINTNKIEKHAVGEHSYEIRPVKPGDNAYYSYWSESVSVNQLAKVDSASIKYDGSYITFDTVGADKYNIYINDQLHNEDVEVKNGQYLYDEREGNFKVRIQAIGDHVTSFDGAKSDEMTFKFLQQVKNIQVVNGGLTWEEIADADGYEIKIKIGNTEIKRNTTKPEYNDATVLKASVDMDITVRAIVVGDGTFFSKFSDVKSVRFLPAPTIKWDKLTSLDGGENSIRWNEVASATGYYVTVIDPDGNSTGSQLSFNAQNYSNLYEKVGEYKVTVTALADEENDNIYSSRPSNEIRVKRIAPAKECANTDSFITSDPTDVTDGFTVSCYDEHINCKYALFRNGTQIAVSDSPQINVPYDEFFKQEYLSGQVITFEVKRMGAGATDNVNVMLNSKEEDNLAFDITILSTPENVLMDGYNITYGSVANATDGYCININGSALPLTETTTSRDISNSLEVGTYNVEVCAKGNGRNVLPSNYSAPVTVIRLDAPTILRIDMNESGGRLVVDAPKQGNADGYQLVLNNKDEDSVVQTIDNMNGKIETAGTDVKVKAVANFYQNRVEKTGIYYMTSKASPSKRFVKLQAPTNLAFTEDSLTWNMTGLNSNQLGNISYIVYDDKKDATISQEVSQTSINFSTVPKFVGGRNYTFAVQAIGDGLEFISSEISTAKQVYKLSTPVVTKNNVTGEYEWYGVSQASSYAVTVDGVIAATIPHATAGEIYKFNPLNFFKDITTYDVKVIAVGNKAIGDSPSINSFACEILQDVVQLSKPTFNVSYSHEQYNVEGKIQVAIDTETPFAKGYKYVIGGNTTSKTEGDVKSFELNVNGTGTFNVDVYAVGGTFNDDGAFTLDSQSNGTEHITILGSVNKENIKYNLNDCYVYWTDVDEADKYIVEIAYNGSNEFVEVQRDDQNHYEIPAENRGKDTLVVRITAIGNAPNEIKGATTTSNTFTL